MSGVGKLLDPASKAQAVRYLETGWRPNAIAAEVSCSVRTIYYYEENLHMFGSAKAPSYRTQGRPPKVHSAAEEPLLNYLKRQPWVF